MINGFAGSGNTHCGTAIASGQLLSGVKAMGTASSNAIVDLICKRGFESVTKVAEAVNLNRKYTSVEAVGIPLIVRSQAISTEIALLRQALCHRKSVA